MYPKLKNPAATLPGLVLALGMTAGNLVGLTTDAAAGTVNPPGPPWSIKSSVDAGVTDNGNVTWSYQYTVYNNSANEYGGVWDTPVIVDWEVPYFGDAGIAFITSPASGWNWAVETIGIENPATGWSGIAAWQDPTDPFYQGPSSPFTTVTKVLHWFVQLPMGQPSSDVGIWPYGATGIPTGAHEGSLTGFGFDADFAPIDGPYQASWYLVPTPRSGDPPLPGGIPASPCALGQCESVPVPGTLLLVGAGLSLMGLWRRRGTV